MKLNSSTFSKIFWVGLMIIFIFLSGCSNRPKGVMSDSKMTDLLTDIILAQSYVDNDQRYTHNDSLKDGIILGVLKKHKVTEEEFDSTISWYGRNMDLYRELFEKVDKKIASRQRALSGAENEGENEINDMWPFSRHTMLTSNSLTDNLNFSFPVSSNKGDKFEWTFRLNKMAEGKIFLGVDYVDGSSSFISKSLYGDRQVAIDLQTDTARIIRRIYGNFRLNSPAVLPVFIDSIIVKSLPFDSLDYFKIHSQKNYYGPKKKQKISENLMDSVWDGDSEAVDELSRETVKRSVGSTSIKDSDVRPPKPGEIHNNLHEIVK